MFRKKNSASEKESIFETTESAKNHEFQKKHEEFTINEELEILKMKYYLLEKERDIWLSENQYLREELKKISMN